MKKRLPKEAFLNKYAYFLVRAGTSICFMADATGYVVNSQTPSASNSGLKLSVLTLRVVPTANATSNKKIEPRTKGMIEGFLCDVNENFMITPN